MIKAIKNAEKFRNNLESNLKMISVKNNQRDFFQKVYDATFEMSEAKICKKFNVSSAYAKHIAIRKLYNTTCYSRGAIGSKTEAYFSESEMLNGFTCKISDLSESEMSIYNGL